MAKFLAYVVYILAICMVGLIAVRAWNDHGFFAYLPFGIVLFLLGYNGRKLIAWMSDDRT